MEPENIFSTVSAEKLEMAKRFKERILSYPNPVEFVNNMYGCHPGEGGTDYFRGIYG